MPAMITRWKGVMGEGLFSPRTGIDFCQLVEINCGCPCLYGWLNLPLKSAYLSLRD